jgi:hypothetical protein
LAVAYVLEKKIERGIKEALDEKCLVAEASPALKDIMLMLVHFLYRLFVCGMKRGSRQEEATNHTAF